MVASANLATASGLQIAPVTLTLQATQNADGIWLSNAGENVLNAQVRVFRWSQSAYDNKLSLSGAGDKPADVGISPWRTSVDSSYSHKPSLGTCRRRLSFVDR
jgi:hypothetical protein